MLTVRLHVCLRRQFFSCLTSGAAIAFAQRYLDLALGAGLAAHRLDDVVSVGPDFVVVDFQAAVIPAAHVDVVIAVLPHLLEVHDFIPVNQRHTHNRIH